MSKPKVVVTNYGTGRNSVLLVNLAILDGIKNAGLLAPDGDLTFDGPVPQDRYNYADEADRKFRDYLKKHGPPDVLVAQAAFAYKVFATAKEQCPNTLRVLQRDSSHAGARKELLDAEYQKLKLQFREGQVQTTTECHEYFLAHRITVLSRWVERTFTGKGLGAKLKYIGPQTIDLSKWKVGIREPDGIDYRVLFSGQIVIRKAAHHLFDAWAKIKPGPGDELVLCGVIAEQGERLRFMEKAFAGCPNSRIVGWRDIYQMWKIYANCDVYCLPSIEEGSSCTCIEALACGRPLIASDNSGSDLLERHDGEIGKLVKTGDIQGLADALAWYRDHARHRRNQGAKARELALADGGMDRFGKTYADAILDMWEQFRN